MSKDEIIAIDGAGSRLRLWTEEPLIAERVSKVIKWLNV